MNNLINKIGQYKINIHHTNFSVIDSKIARLCYVIEVLPFEDEISNAKMRFLTKNPRRTSLLL